MVCLANSFKYIIMMFKYIIMMFKYIIMMFKTQFSRDTPVKYIIII